MPGGTSRHDPVPTRAAGPIRCAHVVCLAGTGLVAVVETAAATWRATGPCPPDVPRRAYLATALAAWEAWQAGRWNGPAPFVRHSRRLTFAPARVTAGGDAAWNKSLASDGRGAAVRRAIRPRSPA